MSWTRELEAAVAAAREAGQAIRAIRQRGFEESDKGAEGPVTTADLEADRILREALLSAVPEAGWLSEESVDDPARLERELTWVVDPLDGTKEFIADIPEYCVSVALVHRHEPVVGVIYNPSLDELTTATKDGGAHRGNAVLGCAHRMGDKPLIAASRSECRKGKWESLLDRCDVRPAGSAAFKLCLVAAGEVDATFTMAPRNEWDIAAGVLIVHEAGGLTCDRNGLPLSFNQRDPLKNGVVASNREAADSVMPLVPPP